ncbi:hybrid sensor histidine kinase/response regulator [Desulfatitalea alkaliphila]|uniref:histidine kinase n=1 Tax=Desulfatitalea alkaliphila TaxID=2929485 RepID=A0AA41R414_9BACT|nr:hybrid sensor histidine kinase/response regulator [Desulfatitalea alkaliphila]MCJ8501954.1 chemotaxis protein CheW [Desulfatitalea alkaliphila]
MTIQDDETLQMYLEESLEHLADIETDLLAIEADGADINEARVNKVYRAAHSIKGGAGFMGLTNIKDLTHEMEDILGRIRNREIIPNPDIINVLLTAADALKALMNDILNSNDVDIADQLQALRAVLHAHQEQVEAPSPPAKAAKAVKTKTEKPSPSPPEQDKKSDADLSLAFPDGRETLSVAQHLVADHLEQGKSVYLVCIDVAQHLRARNRSCSGLLEEMEQTGAIVGANFDLQPSAELDEGWAPDMPTLLFLFATILKPSDINVLFEIETDRILELRNDHRLYPIDGEPLPEEPTDRPDTASLDGHDVAPDPIPSTAAPVPAEASGNSAIVATHDMEDMPMEQVASARETAAANGADKKSTKFEHETSLRVHVSLLDQLMTLAGELVLSRNQLLQSMASTDARGSETAGQRIDLITSELQEAIMLTRMQSIGNVFNKFPRVVRDLARTLGKQVELSLEGQDVELDKTIIEAIGDPLTHLVRNAVDHGIETPAVRQRAGKNPVGQIFLRAYHEAGQVNIEISDNGKGLDGRAIAAKAVEKGLISEEQAKVMSVREKANLIFLPGFSTAETITDVSGRGVGMDVVKTNLDQLGGIIDIDSEAGKGTTIRIKLPLTLAIIPCQIVVTGGERYAIPQVNLEELLRIPANQVRKRIERVGNADVVRLRGNLLPLIRLADIIGVQPLYTDPESGEQKPDRRTTLADRRSKKSAAIPAEEMAAVADADAAAPSNPTDDARHGKDRRFHAAGALNVVVVSTGAMKYGLVVDHLLDSEEIVVKPLGRDLKKCKGYAGATIMGDGRVALILDVSNLAQMGGLTTVEATARASEVAEAEAEAQRAARDKQSLLLFRAAENEQFAAPLSLVERIEKIKRSDIEKVGGQRVMKYRGGSLPLFSIDQVASVGPLADTEQLLVIVSVVGGREIGLLAIGPVDAIEMNLEIDGTTLRQTGIMGSAIINDHTTLLVDIYEIVQHLNPQWFKAPEKTSAAAQEAATILFAEDSSFFRNQVKGSMEKEGFRVLEAEDGQIAWDLLHQSEQAVSLVVTDIEMPNMDGFTLTRKIKESARYAHLPVIALTTLAGEEDIAKGKAVGIDDYQIKLDRERLIRSIHGFLQAAA